MSAMSASSFSLSGEAMLCVCMSLALDPEPLFTLTARTKALLALSETCREARDLVRLLALPALSPGLPDPRRGATPPTVETLVRKTDGELVRLEAALCTVPSSNTTHRARGIRVDALLQLADNDASRWKLVPLKRELRQLGVRVLSARQAMLAYRLRPEDLANLQAPFSREELRTLALNRHGSSRAMLAKDAELRARAKKRADTLSAREDRRHEMHAALESFGVADRDHVCRWHEGARDAIDQYIVRGTQACRDAAVAIFRDAIEGLHLRRALVASLPWPPASLTPTRFATSRDAFVSRGAPSDLEDATLLSSRWTRVTTTLGCERLIDASLLVRWEAKRYLSGETDEADADAPLRAISAAYQRIAEIADRIVGPDHPRYALIRQQFPAAISPMLTHPDAFSNPEVAAAQAARNAVERASTAFCDYVWVTHIATRLPSRMLRFRSLAADTLKRAFADPSLRIDWADVAIGILNHQGKRTGDA